MIREDCNRNENYHLMPDLERVLSASRYLLDLLDDILALTLIEAGKMHVVPSAFQLGPVIRDVVAGIRPVAAKHANRLVIDVDDAGSMYSDRPKIRQLVAELGQQRGQVHHRGRSPRARPPGGAVHRRRDRHPHPRHRDRDDLRASGSHLHGVRTVQ